MNARMTIQVDTASVGGFETRDGRCFVNIAGHDSPIETDWETYHRLSFHIDGCECRDDELLPCPFCGCDTPQRESNNSYNGDAMDDWEWFGIYCPNCKCACTPRFTNPRDAVAAWNRRAK